MQLDTVKLNKVVLLGYEHLLFIEPPPHKVIIISTTTFL